MGFIVIFHNAYFTQYVLFIYLFILFFFFIFFFILFYFIFFFFFCTCTEFFFQKALFKNIIAHM